MNFKLIYKVLILFGIIIFIGGVIADSNAHDILRHGVEIGPYLYLAGVLIWIYKRFKNPILHSFDLKKYQNLLDATIQFLLHNFLLEFWGFCGGIFMILLLNSGPFTKSDAYQAALILMQEDQRITDEIGEFKEAGLMVGGSLNKVQAKLGFSVYGTKGGASINISLTKEEGVWKVESLRIK
ncbi:MAG: hypothetical protein ACJAS3_003690 [Roseivirga sp.]|jgi:hypothetical protein